MQDPSSGFGRTGRIGPGTQLNGTYEIDAPIGEGGMGSVFRGHNIQTGDPVAIKMLLADMAGTPEAMALFRREASVLHALQHDAIVRYFVFSVDPALGIAYLAMEFVDGPSLSDRMLHGPLSRDEVRVLQRRLADGLAAAHRNGVIHRDISPDNIILPGGDVRRAKIIDFGIARNTRSAEATIIGGGFAGKYSWVSPEQLGLAGGEVTDKSDIYSLGLVLAAAMQGRPLDMGGSQLEVIEKRRRVPDLSAIDPSFHEVLTAMLQPLPEHRPASMAEVARWGMTRTQAADLFVEDSYAAAPEPSPTMRPLPGTRPGAEARPAARRSSPLVPILASVAVLALLAGGAAIWTGLIPLGGPTAPTVDDVPGTLGPKPDAKPPETSPDTEPTTPPTPPQEANRAPVAPPAEGIATAGTVGRPFSATIPAFSDPDGDRVGLSLDGGAPAGLALIPGADGSARLTGTPTTAGEFDVGIVGGDGKGGTARLDLRITVAPAEATPPPEPPEQLPEQPPVEAENRPPAPPAPDETSRTALAAEPFTWRLPAFRDPEGALVTVAPSGKLPPGLTLTPLADGSTELRGTPTAPGSYRFALVGTDPAGQSATLELSIDVLPAKPPEPPPNRPPAPPAIETATKTVPTGSVFDWQLPAFSDPDGDRLTYSLDGSVPAGVALTADSGAPRLSGTPTAPGSHDFGIVARDPAGGSARLALALTVETETPAEKPLLPPVPDQAPANRAPISPHIEVSATSATVGTPFGWSLPRFVDPDGDEVRIALAGDAPPGLQLVPEKDGSSRLTGKPSVAGSYDFGVIGSDPGGASAEMRLRIEVARVADPEPPPAGPVDLSPYLAFYDDGACLLAEPSVVSKDTSSFTGYGRSEQVFKDVARRASAKAGFVVTYSFQSVTDAQCPLIDFARDADVRVGEGVTLDIAGRIAGSGRPLKGEIKAAPGRAVSLLLVTNDGGVLRPATPATGDGVWGIGKDPAKGLGIKDTDGKSAGFTQILAAISSSAPIPVLTDPEAPRDATLFARLLDEMRAKGETIDLDLGFIQLEK